MWQAIYALVHLWWAAAGTPRSLADSYFPSGWLPMVIGVAAFAGCGAVAAGARRQLDSTARYAIAVLTAAAGVAMCVYSFLFPVMVASVLFEDVTTETVVRLLVSGGGAAGGVFCLVLAARERRAAAAPRGPVRGGPPADRSRSSPGWARGGAYLAVAGYLARMVVWLEEATAGTWPSAASRDNGTSTTALAVFLGLMSLAGTLLPLALVHRWGRLWPAGTGPLRGRAVPRWSVLGPGLFIGASLTAYFGIVGLSAWIRGDIRGPFPRLLMELGGYTLWGVGLLVACASYSALTRPAPSRAVNARAVAVPVADPDGRRDG
ncbi:hypothetical protein GA0070620_2585 [Micromonospora krabiensis]|uniref:Uncharacterized protein n=1 Tax=Micromonospora krabiensis TaxID=307121 RepID=A0A1C3N3D5_9ACTN|nr:hypothetical protein GA0070620_2585 [Micromonospora krabiensis]